MWITGKRPEIVQLTKVEGTLLSVRTSENLEIKLT